MDNMKFRAWDKDERAMLDVHGINFDAQGIWTNELIDDESDGNFIFLDDVVLMQSTGLRDINGTEIYEGDIVRYNRGISWSVEKFPYVVKNSMEGFVFEYGLIQHSLSKKIEYVTVIGNIYENPELLEDN
ncbi:hypothetical protein BUY73_01090 [Staphylococcus epidermidis]|jgi:uncharacterized phage protein (TIGR01671 family)|uniref:YopX family protein n=2 Tax=root TaxID=1 RepID=I6TG10_9CAUD|nr:YopX family protein [Staphylococcus epidermidis]YP_006560999.1 YopX family protein [Staphylococcus phage Ipla5]AFM73761.1 YopX family protein [Staphylococcus phage Ipla5]EES58695.1 phage conserved hypothetical protein TIGR01671 [Staphylococcus epidermidis BCM-HMP0060]RIL59300.1 hypothetical protein BUY73_01090 [Staphylococcus epidermidis]